MTPSESFATSTGLSGTWPAPPTYWSFSALVEVERCPRQYGLKRASYPEVWDRHGYPDRIAEASIVGTAVHEGVEAILRALNASGCTTVADASAVDALRDLGGYTAVALAAVGTVLAELADNPRMAPQLDRLRERLGRRAPEMRRAIQSLVARTSIYPAGAVAPSHADHPAQHGRSPLGPGAHPEVALVAEDARFTGRVDLLTVHTDHAEVVDFKTGDRSTHHAHQVELYGLLWLLDDIANPNGLPVDSLTLAYIEGDEAVPVPEEWESTQRELREQIQSADRAVLESPPAALPSAECWRCPVRHMCDDYWQSTFVTREPTAVFADAEVVVLRRNGPTSWLARLAQGGDDALIRALAEDDLFAAGDRARVLDVVVGRDPDDGLTVLTVTAGSEVFRLDSS